MPQRPPRLRDVFHTQPFVGTTITQPILRLYSVPAHQLTEVPLSGSGLRTGDRLVMAIDPKQMAERTEQELLDAFHAVIKNLRRVRGVKAQPSEGDLEVYRLRTERGLSYPEIAAKLGTRAEVSHLARQCRRVHKWLARAGELEHAALSAKQREIARLIALDDAKQKQRKKTTRQRARR